MSKNKYLKIIVPAVMVIIVALIWAFQSSSSSSVVDDSEYPLNVTSVNLEELTANNMPMIIDFGADECVPCKEMAPVLVSLNEEMQNKAIIQFVDVWKNPNASADFPIQVIPTQVLVNADGSPYVPSEDLAIEFLMYADTTTGEHVFTVHQGGLTEEQMRVILADMGVQ